MANAYSQLAQYNPPVSSIDVNLTNAVLASKQQAFDANVAKVDAIIESYGNIPLIRPQDKQQLANNINQMLTEVNSHSKMALTDSNTVRQIEQSLKGALTPEIIKQSQNTIKLNSFNQLAGEKRQKNDGTYSDANYQYALDKAGYEAWMRGETDELGNLTYHNYVDEKEAIIKPLESWAKNNGVEVYFTEGESLYDGLVIQNKKGKRLSDVKIKGFLDNIIRSNPNLQKQMEINAHMTYRGYNDEQFLQMYSDGVTERAKEVEAGISEIKAVMSNLNEDSPQYRAYEQQIEEANANLNALKAPINDPTKFNRSAIEQRLYQASVKNGYADTYSYDYYTDILTDDTPLKIAKFGLQQQETERKRNERAGLDASGNPIVAGTPYIVPLTEEEQGKIDNKSTYDIIADDFKTKFSEIDRDLTQVYGTEYSLKSATDKLKFINTLDEITGEYNINKSVLPANTLSKLGEFHKAQKRVGDYKRDISLQLEPIAVDMYNTMVNGRSGIALNYLEDTMPYTANMIRTGKTYDKLNNIEKKAVTVEIARNSREYLARTDEERQDWAVLEKSRSQGLPSDLLQKPQGTGEFWRGAGSIIAGTAGFVWDLGSEFFNRTIGQVRQGTKYADRRSREIEQSAVGNAMRASEGRRQVLSSVGSWFAPDQNLSNLQASDIGTDRSLYAIYESRMNDANIALEASKTTGVVPRTVATGISINPEAKQDKPVADVLNSFARANGINPDPKASYNVEVQGGNYVVSVPSVSYYSEKGVRKINIDDSTSFTIPANQAPAIIKNLLDTTTTQSDPTQLSYTYTVPKTVTEKVEVTNNFLNSFGSQVPPQAADNIAIGKVFSTVEELVAPYKRYIVSPQQRQAVETLMNATYSTRTSRLPSGSFVTELLVNGAPTGHSSNNQNTSQYGYAMMTNALAEMFIKEQLNTLRQ